MEKKREFIHVKSSAPCKCIISGEHSVVYGKPAITAALEAFNSIEGRYEESQETRIKIVLMQNKRSNRTITLDPAEFEKFMVPFVEHHLKLDQLGEFLGDAFEDSVVMGVCMAFSLVFRKIQQSSKVNLHEMIQLIAQYKCLIIINSDVPIGVGLGSSASFGTSLMMNFYGFLRSLAYDKLGFKGSLPTGEDKEGLIRLLEVPIIDLEGYYHQKTSGIDVKTVLRGGFSYFYDGIKKHSKVEQHLDQEKPEEQSRFMLIDTKIHGSTKEAVVKFKEELEKLGVEGKEAKLNEFEEVTNTIKALLDKKGYAASGEFKDLIQSNHELLNKMGVCLPENNKIVTQHTLTTF